MNLERWIRKDILQLTPYASAREQAFAGDLIFLDANENNLDPAGQGLHRYPPPHHPTLRQTIAAWKNVPPECIFLGNGSDEAIDLLIRITCRPARDGIVVLPPTYGMYEVLARLHAVHVLAIPLRRNFQPDVEAILSAAAQKNIRLLFLCSPNNPTGNLFHPHLVQKLLERFPGLVVLDEAYIDFADSPGWLPQLDRYPNLVILQTCSKAMGLAGARLGMAFAHPEIIGVLNRVKPPYNVNQLTARAVEEALQQPAQIAFARNLIRQQREWLRQTLSALSLVKRVYPSQANFLLVRFWKAKKVYEALRAAGIVVRDRSTLPGCKNCLRISVGTPEENRTLIKTLKALETLQ